MTFLFEMNVSLPCSTLALAIGWFECRETSTVALSSVIKCRLFSADKLVNEASEELLPRCAQYVSAACELLGPYPFTRMDLVILPRCFACMGLMRLEHAPICLITLSNLLNDCILFYGCNLFLL